jgi:carbonic anhydrase
MSYADVRPGDELSYAPPRGNVLLLSCMDLRLTDNIVHFMNHDNLENRYDHVIFAGAALGALGAPGAVDEHGNSIEHEFCQWKRVFFQHLGAAIALHKVEDIYILEHRNCGAYTKVFHVCKDFNDSPAQQRQEAECHLKYVKRLEDEIDRWAKDQTPRPKLRVHKFLMGLRGEVTVLGSPSKK